MSELGAIVCPITGRHAGQPVHTYNLIMTAPVDELEIIINAFQGWTGIPEKGMWDGRY